MAEVLPFYCIRPRGDMVQEVASLPYDVFSVEEARDEIAKHEHSFLRIDLAEAVLPDGLEHHDDQIYQTARKLLDKDIADGIYVCDQTPHYFLYRLITPDGRSQTGIVGCTSVDGYIDGTIKRHEKTHPAKEVDRIKHIDALDAHTGPIFLAFRPNEQVEEILAKADTMPPLYDFLSEDGIRHVVWCIDSPDDEAILQHGLDATPELYIADGHHRAMSAARVGLARREDASEEARESGLESDYFMTVMFPSNQLEIMDYNRVVTSLNGYTPEEFLRQISEKFEVSEPQLEPAKPSSKGEFGMYLPGAWYKLTIKEPFTSDDVVDGLDVAILQNYLLDPILGIEDPRTDERISFVGGVRGLKELERRVQKGCAVAFAMYPPQIEELFAVADEDRLMPPKSTWFEPKPRSGIFIHRI